jgi:hypothetical protein
VSILNDLYVLTRLSGAEHEQHYFHGGCPECGVFYNAEFDWQHLTGCSRTTDAEPELVDC